MTACGCTRSVAFVCALFATLAAAAFLAEDRCLDAGGRVSDAAWVCEGLAVAGTSLWSLLSPATAGLLALAVGLPVYIVVDRIGQRLLVRA